MSPSIVRQVLFILLIQQEVFSGRLLPCCDPKVGTNMSGVQISVILNIWGALKLKFKHNN